MSLFSLFIGVLSKIAVVFSEKFINQEINFPHLNEYIGLGDAFLFFAGILYFIHKLFTKGIELQNENELTI